MEDAIKEFMTSIVRDAVKAEVRQAIREVMGEIQADAKKVEETNYSVDQVCKMLHLSKVTLWKKEQKHELIPVRCGRRVLYPESVIQEYIRKYNR